MKTIASTDVGVVVIGRNEGRRLVGALESAQRQCNLIAYVDSSSTDGSVDAALRLGIDVITLMDQPLTAARGRAVGFKHLIDKHSEIRFVQFLDGDCILDDSWIPCARDFLQRNSDVAIVCGRRWEANRDASLYNQLIDSQWDTPIGPTSACGGDSLMRVEALQAAGTFRLDLLAGEEPELCARIASSGWKTWRIDAPMTEHDAAIHHFSQWWRRSERSGFGYAQVWSATRNLTAPLYARQIGSALFWTIGNLLIFSGLSVLIGALWALAIGSIGYALQILRVSTGAAPSLSFLNRIKGAAIIMLVKWAELKGISKYFLGSRGVTPTYEKAAAENGARANTSAS